MTNNSKIITVRLTQYKLGALGIEPKRSETRAFSSIAKAENWLHDNGFVYKHFEFLKEGVEVWGHKTNQEWSYVVAEIGTYVVDSDETYTPDDPNTTRWIKDKRERSRKELDELTLVRLIRINKLTIECAAEKLNMSVAECERILKEHDLRKQCEKENGDTNDKH